MYNPLTERIDLFSELPKDYRGNPFGPPKKEKKDISRRTILKGAILLYIGKKIYDMFRKRSGDKMLNKVEDLLGKDNLIKLDLYASERDADIVESTVMKFNEVLASDNPKSVIGDDLRDYELHYRASMRAIDNSSPDPKVDKDYIQSGWDIIKHITENDG